ncbi:MAG: hypothetical protein RBU30_21220, partial [Polyangia bacterium]|nr:hypothetical protein [Polyangia bacterium]
YVPIEPTDAMAEALRFGLEREIPVALVDRDTEEYPLLRQAVPDPFAVTIIGYEAYCRAYLENPPPPQTEGAEERAEADAIDALRVATMAYHLQELSKTHGRVVFVCGMDHASAVRQALEEPQVRPIGRLRRDGALPYALDAEAAREVTGETPYLMNAYETWRGTGKPEHPPLRPEAQLDLLKLAASRHLVSSHEEVSLGSLAVLRRFSRNYALVEGRLAPDFFQLLIAARGAVNDNFAYEVWDLGTTYDHVEDPASLPTIAPTVEELYRYSRTMRFHRTIKQRRKQLRLLAGERRRERFPGEWKELWRPGAICSHPPEDLVVEGYGAFLMKKARKILGEESSRSQPFSTSLLDGIDVRETLRNWHEGRIYVRELQPVRGRVGAVVMIFDPDEATQGSGPEKYPWRLTWQGEHDQESDMAFYATPLGEHLVGPGISKCEYGGFLLSYPPGRMFHVWEDPFFARSKNKPERLLLAAIDHCMEKYILYVAASPPRDFMKSVAARFGKKVIYLPIGQLSPVTLRKVKVFHVLEGYHVRGIAKDYIF